MRSRATLFLLCLSACTTGSAAPSPIASAAPAPVTSGAAALPPVSSPGMPTRVPEELDPHSPARSVREATLRGSGAYATVRSLVDEAGPRLSGSPGHAAALGRGGRTTEA